MENGRARKAVKNVTYNFICQVLSLIFAFISRTVFVRVFGIEYLGLNGIFSDVLGLLTMADLGFNTAMVFSYYKPLSEGDTHKIAALTLFYKKVYLIIACVVSGGGILLMPFLPGIVHTNTLIPHIQLYYGMALLNIALSYVGVHRISILTADQKGYKLSKIKLGVETIKTIIQIVTMISTKSYLGYLLIGCIATLINNILGYWYSRKEYYWPEKKYSLSVEEKNTIWKSIKSAFIYKISSVLLNATDNILISIIVGTSVVGIYSNYVLIQSKITLFYSLFFTSLTSSIGNLIYKENEKKRYDIFMCEQTISFVICTIIVPCYFFLVNDFINLWLGDSYVLPSLTVVAISLNMYLSCVLQPLWSYRDATGLYEQTKWVMLICGGINIVLSIIGGYKLGVTGILMASAVSRLLTYIWYEPRVLFEEYFKRKAYYYFIRLLCNAALVSAMIFMTFVVMKMGDFAVASWMQLGIKAGVVGGICIGVTYITYKNSEGIDYLVKLAKRIL